ncbi:uncharacterized protein LOC143032330 [Oratosquilla oratoria]|uniref:uncharacterized protein LOC143032330 n=1 Tax=Oratosquilla oratoria TaxID=337810 RepID=UPI003F773BA0
MRDKYSCRLSSTANMAAKPTLLLFIVFAVVLEPALGSPTPKDQGSVSKTTEDNLDTEIGISISQLRTTDAAQEQEQAAVGAKQSREEDSQSGVGSGGTGEQKLGEKENISEGDDDNDDDDDESDSDDDYDDDDDDGDDTEGQDRERLASQEKNVDTQYVKRSGNDDENVQESAQLPTPAYLTDQRTILNDGTYVVYENGNACILAYINLQVTLYYSDKQDTPKKVVSLPDDDTVKITGTCDRVAQTGDVVVSWDAFEVIISFEVDGTTNSWYVSKFKVVVDLSDSLFQDAKSDDKVTITSPDGKRYWQTSLDRSFRCSLLHDVSLSDEDGEYSGSIHMGEARVQAFSDGVTFKMSKYCTHRSKRDEMVPITVGAVLASLTLVTITGYAIFSSGYCQHYYYNWHHVASLLQ